MAHWAEEDLRPGEQIASHAYEIMDIHLQK